MSSTRGARSIRWLLVIGAGLGAISLFLLATATANTHLFAGSYDVLLVLNTVIVVLLMALVGYQLWRLRRKLRKGVFGSRLALRLVLLFALVAVLPGAIVYGVSVQFLGKSIESWFDVRVDRALEGGLNLGRSSLDNLLKETGNRAAQPASRRGLPGPPNRRACSRRRCSRPAAACWRSAASAVRPPRRSRRRRRRCGARGCSNPTRRSNRGTTADSCSGSSRR
jgi:hypothetical protein